MTKIVYNACYGGFSLSEAACNLYDELKTNREAPQPTAAATSRAMIPHWQKWLSD